MVAVVTLAGGAGSRWTKGAGVVKALHPFSKLAGRHRNFIEAHLAKSSRSSRIAGMPLPHVITTSYLTHDAVADWLGPGRSHGVNVEIREARPGEAWAGRRASDAGVQTDAAPISIQFLILLAIVALAILVVVMRPVIQPVRNPQPTEHPAPRAASRV